MYIGRVKNWITHFKSLLFTFKDGYWQLPYLANDPAVMINSLHSMPFNKHDGEKRIIYTNNPFCKGQLCYSNLETGLWAMSVDIEMKANILYKAVYDDYQSGFYTLTIYSNLNDHEENCVQLNDLVFEPNMWVLNKPGEYISSYNDKGSRRKFLNIYFDYNWLENNILQDDSFQLDFLKEFLQSEHINIMWSVSNQKNVPMVMNTIGIMEDRANDGSNSLLQQKISVLGLMQYALQHIHTDKSKTDIKSFPKKVVTKINAAHEIVLNSYQYPFPGMESIAQQVDMSESNLKKYFKLIYGKTLFELYQEKRLQWAKSILETGNKKIKDIAYELGYENPSKFTMAYKKMFGILPSETDKKVLL